MELNKIEFANGKVIYAKNISESANVDGRQLRFNVEGDFTELINILHGTGNRTNIKVYSKDGESVILDTKDTYTYGSFNIDRNISANICSVVLNSIA